MLLKITAISARHMWIFRCIVIAIKGQVSSGSEEEARSASPTTPRASSREKLRRPSPAIDMDLIRGSLSESLPAITSAALAKGDFAHIFMGVFIQLLRLNPVFSWFRFQYDGLILHVEKNGVRELKDIDVDLGSGGGSVYATTVEVDEGDERKTLDLRCDTSLKNGRRTLFSEFLKSFLSKEVVSAGLDFVKQRAAITDVIGRHGVGTDAADQLFEFAVDNGFYDALIRAAKDYLSRVIAPSRDRYPSRYEDYMDHSLLFLDKLLDVSQRESSIMPDVIVLLIGRVKLMLDVERAHFQSSFSYKSWFDHCGDFERRVKTLVSLLSNVLKLSIAPEDRAMILDSLVTLCRYPFRGQTDNVFSLLVEHDGDLKLEDSSRLYRALKYLFVRNGCAPVATRLKKEDLPAVYDYMKKSDVQELLSSDPILVMYNALVGSDA